MKEEKEILGYLREHPNRKTAKQNEFRVHCTKSITFLLAFVTICLTSYNGQAQIILGPKVGINLGSPIPMPSSDVFAAIRETFQSRS